MTDTAIHQAISTAANLHAMISSRIVNSAWFIDSNGEAAPWSDTEERLAFLSAVRLLNKRFNDCYECLCNDETDGA